jgi:hypothetical protein
MASWETFIKSVALSPIKETLEKIVFTNGFSVKCLGDFSVIICVDVASFLVSLVEI